MPDLNSEYWNKRYETDDFPWDIGYISTPLKEYFDKLENKDLFILIPGAGNSWEAEYLHLHGFKNVFILDYAEVPLKNFSERVPSFPTKNLICEDFFSHSGKYDLIIEQTFFCAIDPSLRTKYAQKMAELLNPAGKLAGLLFNDPLNSDKPPFGGSSEDYKPIFEPYFRLDMFEIAKNSIGPRSGREIFIELSLR
jgi:methyl halide transferase